LLIVSIKDRDADGPRLVRDRPRDRLPIHHVAYVENLYPLRYSNLSDGLHQADVALLDQVEELESPVGVLLRDRHHQPQVRLDQLALGLPTFRSPCSMDERSP
jgi:hypothetical protein